MRASRLDLDLLLRLIERPHQEEVTWGSISAAMDELTRGVASRLWLTEPSVSREQWFVTSNFRERLEGALLEHVVQSVFGQSSFQEILAHGPVRFAERDLLFHRVWKERGPGGLVKRAQVQITRFEQCGSFDVQFRFDGYGSHPLRFKPICLFLGRITTESVTEALLKAELVNVDAGAFFCPYVPLNGGNDYPIFRLFEQQIPGIDLEGARLEMLHLPATMEYRAILDTRDGNRREMRIPIEMLEDRQYWHGRLS